MGWAAESRKHRFSVYTYTRMKIISSELYFKRTKAMNEEFYVYNFCDSNNNFKLTICCCVFFPKWK